jgi:3D (Asp-Asp-Asp) domain-containing protein
MPLLWLVPGLVPALVPTANGEEAAGRFLGSFRVTYYYVAEERAGGAWPLFGPRCAGVLARTSREFHNAISREGTGRLRDGRLLNFSERCPCARDGHEGSRICYEEVDQAAFPWGKGGTLAGSAAPLRPFRTAAVDPALIPLGTVLYIPAWRGGHWPDGTVRDGCFRAADSGSAIRGRHVDLFAGRPEWAQALARRGPGRVRVFRNAPACAHLAREG